MTDVAIKLDYNFALGPQRDVLTAALEEESRNFGTHLTSLLQACERGEGGFWNLINDDSVPQAVNELGPSLPDVDAAWVLGMGGASLGGQAIQNAFSFEAVPPNARVKRLFFLDNSDPWRLSQLSKVCDPKRTLVVVCSKSGSTLETAGIWFAVRNWQDRVLTAEQALQRTVVITDPVQGWLRKQVQEQNYKSLPVPPTVGGRFSVLSAVGLLPAWLLGLDINAFSKGAQTIAQACRTPDIKRNPAGLLALFHFLHHRLCKRPLHVMMPYSDRLRSFGDWFVQLWSESLGKSLTLDNRPFHDAPTPMRAVGATDQHSQLQLFMEGPDDKLITFIGAQSAPDDLSLSVADSEWRRLNQVSLQTVLNMQMQSTAQALVERGRPSLCLEVGRLDEAHLGALFFLYEMTTAIAGRLYSVNAYNQPGVERSKELTELAMTRFNETKSTAISEHYASWDQKNVLSLK